MEHRKQYLKFHIMSVDLILSVLYRVSESTWYVHQLQRVSCQVLHHDAQFLFCEGTPMPTRLVNNAGTLINRNVIQTQ